MKFQYNVSKKSLIKNYENQMLKKYIEYINYLETINDFHQFCDKYNCSIKIGLSWINQNTQKYSDYRIPITKDYSCCVYFELQKSNSTLCVKSYDGEADYYPISASWIITSTTTSIIKKNKFSIEFCADEINKECVNDIKILFELLSSADENDIFFTHKNI